MLWAFRCLHCFYIFYPVRYFLLRFYDVSMTGKEWSRGRGPVVIRKWLIVISRAFVPCVTPPYRWNQTGVDKR